jgi:ribonuclease J
MRLRIHRGANEIGGNCVEIDARGHSILLDLGLRLCTENLIRVDDVMESPMLAE